MTFAGLSALLLTVPGFAQVGATPAQAPVEYSRGQLQTEQRVMQAYITDANFHIDRGIKAVGANLPDSAKVSVLRATGRVALVDEMMKANPERIEHLAFSLLYRRETVREELRASYSKLRDEFGAVEDAMYALRRDMLRKGLFGEELKQQVAVLDAATKLLPEIEKKDPAMAGKMRGLIEEINKALASGDTAKADALIKQLNSMLEGAGYKPNIEEAKRKIGEGEGGGAGAGGGTQSLAGGGSVAAAAGGVTVTGRNGQTTMISGATSLGGGKIRLADGTEVDLNNSEVTPNGIRLSNGRILKPDGTVVAGATPGGSGASYVDASGNEIVIPADFGWKNGEAKGVERAYVGSKGARLTRETKVTFRPTPSPTAPNTYVVNREDGESRTWAFEVAPLPGSEKKSGGSLAITLALTDRAGGTAFTVDKWEITSPSGSPTLSGTAGAQVTATFNTSATYTFKVSGATDWGSAFVITTSRPIGVE